MFEFSTKIRVRYSETDKMGFVYYGNYPAYYEVGRTESLRQLGTSYKELEDSGVLMPVYDMNIKYIRPAKYDDLLTVKTIIKKLPETRMVFDYEIYNQDKVLINKASTTLIFLSEKTQRPVKCPEWMLNIFKKEFNQD